MDNKELFRKIIKSYSGRSGASGYSGISGSDWSGINGYKPKNIGPGYGSQPIDQSNKFGGLLLESIQWWKINDLSDNEKVFIITLARSVKDRPWIKISDLSKILNITNERSKILVSELNKRYPHFIYEAKYPDLCDDEVEKDPDDYEIAYWENYIDYMNDKGLVWPGANYLNRVKKIKKSI